MKRPTLGVFMIVKNEEARLENILSEIKDVVDEIVVVDTGSSYAETSEHALAQHLAEIAVRLDVSSSGAHLFLADLFADKGDTPRMIASLETALKNGADGDEVLRRIELAEHTSNTTS